MILSAYQPYFAPFPGFFAKAFLSDCLVLMDAVQFPRGTTWLTRNRLKHDQGTLWLTVPVWKKGLGLQKVSEVRIYGEGRWAEKHLAGLKSAYRKAPFFEDHVDFLEALYKGGEEKLADFNWKIIRYLMDQLQVSVRLVRLSDLQVDLKEPQLSIELCRRLGASRFLAQPSAKKFLPQEAFRKAGVELRFFAYRPPVYPQLWGPFIQNLSSFDLLFCCGPKAGTVLRRHLKAPAAGAFGSIKGRVR